MLNDWIQWVSSLPRDRLLWLLAPLLLVDVPRYALGAAFVWLVDFCRDVWQLLSGQRPDVAYRYCPSVCVVIAGLNEGKTVGHTLASIWGTYPNLEIIVVDDGSTDGMARVAQDFANRHANVLVLRKPQRGGKSSALNFALAYVKAEIVVCVDADSHLSPAAIWEIVQPLSDPRIGAVSGAVLSRNPFTNLATWLQAFEYLRGIFIGRMYMSRLGVLGIVSGAFGAYRREALERVGGWDVGPGEDGDLTLRLRRADYDLVFAPYAQCLTNVPTEWLRLIKQRRRWDWAVVTFECRKHVDIADPRSPNFRLDDFAMILDRWLLNVLFVFGLWAYAAWICFHVHEHTRKQLFLYYLVYVAMDVVNLLVALYYSTNRLRDLAIGLATPLMPFYHLLMRLVSLHAIVEEMFTRRSFRDGFVPQHVREATWHW